MTEDEPKVWIFYSSKTEPELLVFYADGLAYLKDNDIEMKVVDIAEDPDTAREYDVTSTPTVLIEEEGEIEEEFGVVSYLNGILEKENLKEIIEGKVED